MTKEQAQETINSAIELYNSDNSKLSEAVDVLRQLYTEDTEAKQILLENEEASNLIMLWSDMEQNNATTEKEMEDEPEGENSCCSCNTTG